MPITIKISPQVSFVRSDVVFSTVQIEQSQFTTLPSTIQVGPQIKPETLEERIVVPEKHNEPSQST